MVLSIVRRCQGCCSCDRHYSSATALQPFVPPFKRLGDERLRRSCAALHQRSSRRPNDPSDRFILSTQTLICSPLFPPHLTHPQNQTPIHQNPTHRLLVLVAVAAAAVIHPNPNASGGDSVESRCGRPQRFPLVHSPLTALPIRLHNIRSATHYSAVRDLCTRCIR